MIENKLRKQGQRYLKAGQSHSFIGYLFFSLFFSSSGIRQRDSVGDPCFCVGNGLGWYIPHQPENQHPFVLVCGC